MGSPPMSTAATMASDGYALARTPEEYERLRAQSRVWEPVTARMLDRIGLAPGARCLDAGCGPGETMRLMAERVGPSGRVLGIDLDAPLGAHAIATLRDAGHPQCDFAQVDLAAGDPLPGAPFDVVHARLILFHLPGRVAVLERLWDAVAPGGHLLVQDYDVGAAGVIPSPASIDEFLRVMTAAFEARGCDINVGSRLPQLFAESGVGTPDGTDVAGRLEQFATAAPGLFAPVYRGVLATALAHGITTEADAGAWELSLLRDAQRFPDRPTRWPLLVSAWKRKVMA
jgi:SAM-dependent methyltransferase